MTDIRVILAAPPGARRGAALGFGFVALIAAMALATLPFRGHVAPLVGAVALAATGAVMLERIAAFHPHPRFGLGNAVTLVRAGGAAVFVALAVEPQVVTGVHAWAALGLATALLALDGLDGWAARRQGLASAFGARFDMEIDALLILALAAIAAGLGKAGPWVLGLGLLRYVFVLAGRLHPPLARPLPASRRRRAVCGVQVLVLGLLLAPALQPPWSEALAAIAFAALSASFAIDVAWLLRQPR
jgi:phosphatidylglycerophosphate synthase